MMHIFQSETNTVLHSALRKSLIKMNVISQLWPSLASVLRMQALAGENWVRGLEEFITDK